MPEKTPGALEKTAGLPSVTAMPTSSYGSSRGGPSRTADESRALEADSGAPNRLRETLLVILVSALILLAGIGGLYALSLLDQRDATIAALERNVANLEGANRAFSQEILDLGTERQVLLETRQNLTRERDTLAASQLSLSGERASTIAARDQLLIERDRLNAKIGDLDKQLADYKELSAEGDRQMSQARDEIARQQARVKAVEARNATQAEIIKLDGDIHREFATFMGQYDVLIAAYQRSDFEAVQTAHQKGMASAARIDSLLNRRDNLMAQLN